MKLLQRYRMLFAVFRSLGLLLSPIVLLVSLTIYTVLHDNSASSESGSQGALTPGLVFGCLAAVNAIQMPFQNTVEIIANLVEGNPLLTHSTSRLGPHCYFTEPSQCSPPPQSSQIPSCLEPVLVDLCRG